MKYLPVITLILIAISLLIKFALRKVDELSKMPPCSLEEKLAILQGCGLKLAEPFTVDDLLESFERSDYEKPSWETVLLGLGIEDEIKGGYHCANLWSFDTECIEDHGDYAMIAQRMADMAQGSLPLKNIKDYVDIDNDEAWLSFTLNGQEMKWDCKVDDDWVDTNIIDELARLLERTDSSKTYIYRDMGGQCCLIGCVTKAELKLLQDKGVDFEPMNFEQ